MSPDVGKKIKSYIIGQYIVIFSAPYRLNLMERKELFVGLQELLDKSIMDPIAPWTKGVLLERQCIRLYAYVRIIGI